MAKADAETFLPQPSSDYDGWPLDPQPAVQCPDCDEQSGEFEELGALLKWIDEHVKTCAPAWLDLT
jgi:hypothetical protein